MSQLTVQDGKLVLRDGKLGVGQACCCGGGCTGRCNFQVNAGGLVNTECEGGCECITHPCGCFDIDQNGTYPWYFCRTACDGERIAFAVCLTAPTEQAVELRGPLEGWVGAVLSWMENHGYSNTSFDSGRCFPVEENGGGEGGSQRVMIVGYGCCEDGFDLEGECLSVLDLEPALEARPYTTSVSRYKVDGTSELAPDCVPPNAGAGFVVPPCAGNPLP